MSIAECLQQAADKGKNGDSDEAWLPSPFICAWECNESTNDGSSLHDADEIGRKVRFLDFALAFIVEFVLEGGHGGDASNDTWNEVVSLGQLDSVHSLTYVHAK